MTDRVHSLTLVLEKDVRDDDIHALVVAAGQLKGVVSVGTNITELANFSAESRTKSQVLAAVNALHNMLYEKGVAGVLKMLQAEK